MIIVNCTNCPNHCCGMNPKLTPVLMPSEENYFRENSISVQTPSREMHLLGKKDNGNCTFFDEKNGKCNIYENRPLECRLFPFLLSFEDVTKPSVRLDLENCPHLSTLVADEEKILSLLRKYEFTKNWIEGYDSLNGV